MRYLFVYQKMKIGGCQLLIQKVGSQMVSDGNDVSVICETIEQSFKEQLNDNNVRVIELGFGNWFDDGLIKNTIKMSNQANNLRIVTFIWVDYIRLVSLAEIGKNVLFYAVHSDAVKRASDQRGLIGKANMLLVRRLIIDLIHNHKIVLMDEQTTNHTLQHYNIKHLVPRIIRIPVDTDVEDFDLDSSIEKFKEKRRRILTIARADFPFKGYIFGLMDIINKNSLPDNYELFIISYGDDYSKIEDKYGMLSDIARRKIHLIGKVPYDCLKDYFYKSHLYVGMGTTLLDASKYGVISIPVVPYTYEVLSNSFFCDDFKSVACDSGNEESFLNLVKHFDALSLQKVRDLIIKSRTIIDNYYSTKACANGLYESFDVDAEIHQGYIKLLYLIRRIARSQKGKEHDNAK